MSKEKQTSDKQQSGNDFIADVSCSTDKLIFLYNAIDNKREIAAHGYNNVFMEFEERFYNGKRYRNALANFKKYMKLAAENRGHEVHVVKATRNGVDNSIRKLWRVKYRN